MEHLLVADQVIAGNGVALEPGAIHLRNGAIVAVGRPGEFGDQPTMPVRRYKGASILPGLVDTHAHVTFPGDGTTYEELAERTEDDLVATATGNLRKHAAAGVTTIRDNGAPHRAAFALREHIATTVGYPRLLICGPPVTPTGGHLHWCGGCADGNSGVRAAVAGLSASGADHVKVMASGGGTAGTAQWQPSYDLDALHTLVAEAHGRGLPVAAHCHATVAMERALLAGVDVLEHASFITPPTPGTAPRRVGAAWSGLISEYSPRIADLIGERGAFVGATLQGGLQRRNQLRALQEVRTLSDEEEDQLVTATGHMERKVGIVAALVSAGLRERIVISTDAGPADTAFGKLPAALQAAASAGLSNLEVISAATGVAARALGMSDRIGTLRAGMAADVLVVDGNPAEDLSCLERVRDVYIAGARVHEEVDRNKSGE